VSVIYLNAYIISVFRTLAMRKIVSFEMCRYS